MDEPNGGPYQFVEPQQECRFIPRKRDESSADILAKAASWYGGRLVPVIDGEVVEPGHVLVRYSIAPMPEAQPKAD